MTKGRTDWIAPLKLVCHETGHESPLVEILSPVRCSHICLSDKAFHLIFLADRTKDLFVFPLDTNKLPYHIKTLTVIKKPFPRVDDKSTLWGTSKNSGTLKWITLPLSSFPFCFCLHSPLMVSLYFVYGVYLDCSIIIELFINRMSWTKWTYIV